MPHAEYFWLSARSISATYFTCAMLHGTSIRRCNVFSILAWGLLVVYDTVDGNRACTVSSDTVSPPRSMAPLASRMTDGGCESVSESMRLPTGRTIRADSNKSMLESASFSKPNGPGHAVSRAYRSPE